MSTFTHALSTNNYGCSKFIVDASAANGTHTTIAAALTSASSGDTIFIRPGTYTENLTLKAGVNLCAFGPFDSFSSPSTIPNVIISGKCSFSSAGNVGISGICLQTNSDFALAVTGSAASVVTLNNCYIYALNNTAISFTSSAGSGSSQINMNYCGGDIGTTGIALFAHSGAGYLSTNFCYFENNGASLTANTLSGTGSEWFARYTTIRNGTTYTGTATLQYVHCEFSMVGNQTALTFNATGANAGCYYCFFGSGTSSAISIGAGATVALHYCFLSSSNASTIGGTGTLTLTNLAFNSVASLAAGLTLSNGSANSFFSGGGVGTAGQVWTSNGASTPPTFQSVSGGFTLATPQATTSGTAFDFTGIPAGTKLIKVMFSGVSLSGTDLIVIQIGDAGGIETTGYAGITTDISSTNVTWSTYAPIAAGGNASVLRNGIVDIALENSSTNTWIFSGSSDGVAVIASTDHALINGSKSLSDTLTQVRITRSGTNTFDAGSVNIMYAT